MSPLVSLLAIAAAAVVCVRCVCVLYHTHWSSHPRDAWHWMGFGYSYVALAAAAVTGAVAVITGDIRGAWIAVGLFMAASAGLIAFDRRADVCGRARSCVRREAP